jgi:hypothetical protein
MSLHNLDYPHLITLFQSVFGFRKQEGDCTILIDLPNDVVRDHTLWMDRRRIAAEWYALLGQHVVELPFAAVSCCAYENVGTNNGDLPCDLTLIDRCTKSSGGTEPRVESLEGILQRSSIVIAMTEFSATAPLKNLAKRFAFRGATLPGFTRQMIPALSLNYEEVHARVMQIKGRLDRAERADLRLTADGQAFEACFDLRHRPGHSSGGILRDDGTVGNLPSGEAYIVPYEGEKPGLPSATEGILPVQFNDEVVLFRLAANRAVEVLSDGRESETQKAKLAAEPAYGNIAELGIGVLGEWGIEGVGSALLDEKLGLHIAFGRSDHFGGATSAASFRNPGNVVHIDWVYIPSIQPRVRVEELLLHYHDGISETVIHSGRLVV